MAAASAHGPNYSMPLQTLMAQAGLPSYRSLSATAGVSRWAIDQLRQGQIGKLRVEVVLRLSQALQVAPADLLTQFSQSEPQTSPPQGQPPQSLVALQQEYDRLQQRLSTQAQEVRQQMQREAIAQLESWLLQWPTAVYAAQQNMTIPATRLIPLAKPLDDLLQAWDITPIGTVGAEVAYDPQIHQPMGDPIAPGQRGRVRYVGYYHGDLLLYRAKVSPIE